MKKLILALVCAGSLSVFAAETKTDTKAAAAPAASQTWTGVSMCCGHCSGEMKGNADSHDRACMMKCSASGFGVFTADGKFLTFDKAGNDKAMALLKASDKKDHIRCTVTGAQDGTTIKVSSITLN